MKRPRMQKHPFVATDDTRNNISLRAVQLFWDRIGTDLSVLKKLRKQDVGSTGARARAFHETHHAYNCNL